MNKKASRRNRQIADDVLHIKRRHSRIEVQGFEGDIADGNFVIEGVVDDVSFGGFKMSNLPRNFLTSSQNYTTVVSGKGKHFRLIVTPCWKKIATRNHSMEVGFKIVGTPWEWSEFITNEISTISKDHDLDCQD